MADLREDVIKKLEEERKQKEEELKKILNEIEEKSNQLKKEKEIEEMIKELESRNRAERKEENSDEIEQEDKRNIEEELTLTYESTQLYKPKEEENNLYSISLNTMQNVYETTKSLSQLSREGKLSENELDVILNLEEALEGTNPNYIPSEKAVMLLQTSKSLLNEIRKYNS
ncbi:MAG: hypothetical protein PWR30_32 [Candidatus Woesearchaeota archaeon]|nr:hypothetical protein [Candidatus Woesearchaeota archaeon]